MRTPLPAPPGPRLPIDPRIRQRRIEIAREQGRRRLRALLAALAAAAFLGAGAGSLYSPILAVHHVGISERGGQLSRASVLSAAGLGRSIPMVDVDPARIAGRLDRVPWIGGAAVARRWPSTVRISLVVRAPVGQVRSGGGWALLDPTGRVLAVVGAPEPGLPVLSGMGAAPGAGRWLPGTAGPSASPGRPPARTAGGPGAALAFLSLLPPAARADLSSMAVGPGGVLSGVVSVGAAGAARGGSMASAGGVATGSGQSVDVMLGGDEELAAKAAVLTALLGSGDLTGVTAIDLTAPYRPAALTASRRTGSLSTQAGG